MESEVSTENFENDKLNPVEEFLSLNPKEYQKVFSQFSNLDLFLLNSKNKSKIPYEKFFNLLVPTLKNKFYEAYEVIENCSKNLVNSEADRMILLICNACKACVEEGTTFSPPAEYIKLVTSYVDFLIRANLLTSIESKSFGKYEYDEPLFEGALL